MIRAYEQISVKEGRVGDVDGGGEKVFLEQRFIHTEGAPITGNHNAIQEVTKMSTVKILSSGNF